MFHIPVWITTVIKFQVIRCLHNLLAIYSAHQSNGKHFLKHN